MTSLGRTWKLWAYRYESGALWHVGERKWVELHQLGHPLVAVLAEEIKDYMELNGMFFDLMSVFMGLGLIVGIAALGVIATRSVVERRQQIGVTGYVSG